MPIRMINAIALATIHHVAKVFPTFEYLENETEDKGIRFKIMSSDGRHDITIANHIEAWLESQNVQCERCHDRCLRISNENLQKVHNLHLAAGPLDLQRALEFQETIDGYVDFP